MSLLTKELKKLGFQCGIEFQAYIQNTGKYTSLIIEENGKLVIPSIPMIFTR